jgi:hypothetical protein
MLHQELVRRASPDLPIPTLDPALLASMTQPRLTLLWGVNTPTRTLLGALTMLAARGLSVRVFDGGNRFDGYFVARLARRLAPDLPAVMGRIRLSRAFTCFQLAELIENALPEPAPLFGLDFLATFYDESVPLRDSERLLSTTLAHLKRLAAAGPVIIGAQEPRSLVKERWSLLDQLQAAADGAWLLRPPETQPPLQPQLFTYEGG